MVKSGTLAAPNAGKNVEQGELIEWCWECKMETVTLEDNLAASYKIKHSLTRWFGNTKYDIYLQIIENLYLQTTCHEYLYKFYAYLPKLRSQQVVF